MCHTVSHAEKGVYFNSDFKLIHFSLLLLYSLTAQPHSVSSRFSPFFYHIFCSSSLHSGLHLALGPGPRQSSPAGIPNCGSLDTFHMEMEKKIMKLGGCFHTVPPLVGFILSADLFSLVYFVCNNFRKCSMFYYGFYFPRVVHNVMALYNEWAIQNALQFSIIWSSSCSFLTVQFLEFSTGRDPSVIKC